MTTRAAGELAADSPDSRLEREFFSLPDEIETAIADVVNTALAEGSWHGAPSNEAMRQVRTLREKRTAHERALRESIHRALRAALGTTGADVEPGRRAADVVESLEQVAVLVCHDCRTLLYAKSPWFENGCEKCGGRGVVIPMVLRTDATPVTPPRGDAEPEMTESFQRGLAQAARGEGEYLDTRNLPTDESITLPPVVAVTDALERLKKFVLMVRMNWQDLAGWKKGESRNQLVCDLCDSILDEIAALSRPTSPELTQKEKDEANARWAHEART